MSLSKQIILPFLVIFCILEAINIAIFYYYFAFRPKIKDESLGFIFEIKSHDTSVFVSQLEKAIYEISFILPLLVFAALFIRLLPFILGFKILK